MVVEGSVMEPPKATQEASLDFRGVYRARGGAYVRIQFWHQPWKRWIGKVVQGGEYWGTWDGFGNATDSRFDLVHRVEGEAARHVKFSRW